MGHLAKLTKRVIPLAIRLSVPRAMPTFRSIQLPHALGCAVLLGPGLEADHHLGDAEKSKFRRRSC
jgi:hypothetical protein